MLEHSTILHPQFCLRFGYSAQIVHDPPLWRRGRAHPPSGFMLLRKHGRVKRTRLTTSRNRTGSETREQRKLLARQEAKLQPTENVIHQRLRITNLLVARPARGLKASMRKLLA